MPALTSGEVVVRAEGLGKSFGTTRALDGVSFELRRGELVGLLGRNGAGKTTTLKMLLGLLRPTHGRAEVLGLDCTQQAREVKRRLGYSPDEPAFYDFLTGQETALLACELRGLDPKEVQPALDAAIEALELAPQMDQLTSSYSHGMKKKLALLLALIHRPDVLLLDEPTNGLDPPMAARVRELLQDLARQHGRTVLVSTHLLDMAERLCDRILVIHQGRLLAQGTAAELRERAGLGPTETLEAAFLRLVA